MIPEVRPVFIKTFGCKVNYTESVAFAELAARRGLLPIELTGASLDCAEAGGPPVVFINSCCVTAEAERKAAQFVRRIRREHPRCEVLFSGCGARNHLTRQKYIDAGARVFDFHTEAFEWLAGQDDTGVDAGEAVEAAKAHFSVEEPDVPFESGIIGTARSRAFIKVQDGCRNFCTFCVIPFVRPYASRPVDEVLDEAERFIDQGFRELVLTGINIGHYGMTPVDSAENIATAKHWKRSRLYSRREDHPSFFDLVDSLLERIPEGTRLRVSSIEPEDIDDRFFEQLVHPRMCPHLHLPLQSGSDRVLGEMRRLYTTAEYARVAEQFRRACPDGALTTDILVGFPAETEQDFQQTLEVCSQLQFERIHGFPFSPRPGTAAARMKQLARTEVQERNRRLIAHCAPIAEERWRRFVGSQSSVLVEERLDGGAYSGHGEAYQQVRLRTTQGEVEPGQIVQVKLEDFREGRFFARIPAQAACT
jgi:threonylcarbamoyladenosine tRNA methylthiotransferase MtaB